MQCEQDVMFCYGAEIVPKRSRFEHKPYSSYNLQRSLLIRKDHLPILGSVEISSPMKFFRLDSDCFKILSGTENFLHHKSQGTLKMSLFSQGTYNFQNLRNETLDIAVRKHLNTLKFFLIGYGLMIAQK